LLVFDQLVQRGPSGIAHAAETYAERYPQTIQDRPVSERTRIQALGDIFKTLPGLPAFMSSAVARRVDTIITGRGSIRGVSFDLDQLGVSDAG
jgi:hypothetical protein